MRVRAATLGSILLTTSLVWGRPASAGLADAQVALTEILTLNEPVDMATRAGDPRLYFAEKGGRVKAWNGITATTVLDISTRVSTGGERGLLGLTFSPSGRRLFVNYTNLAGDTLVKGFRVRGGRIRRSSEFRVLKVDQPEANHNGGHLAYGPDGFLYIALGDGGGAGDPLNNGQRTNTLLGKMLRIRPDRSSGYTSPRSNPFVGRPGRNAIWALGLRNPWRFSFDRLTGDLWTADVGQGAWEEINRQPRSSRGGENYGWRRMEGTHSFNGGTPPPGHDPPVYEYANDAANCAVAGGYVYRGTAIPDLVGAYVFADFCAAQLRAFTGDATDHRFLGVQVSNPSSFGEDQNGELYVLSLSGKVFRIDPGA